MYSPNLTEPRLFIWITSSTQKTKTTLSTVNIVRKTANFKTASLKTAIFKTAIFKTANSQTTGFELTLGSMLVPIDYEILHIRKNVVIKK